MSISTLLKYLVGNRQAIQQITSTPHSIWLGALFVFAAGLAREYDAKDLTHQPWYLIVPLVASLATSFLLYTLVFAVGLRRSTERWPFVEGYREFLSLYWMTAPLAFLYAIPADRLLSANDATATNLVLLAIVSLWRVALMVRVVMVHFNATIPAALCVVMLFADSVALAVLYFTPLPIFNIMGGIELSKDEQLIRTAAFWVSCLGVPTWLIWFIGVIRVCVSGTDWEPHSTPVLGSNRVAPSLWLLTAGMILVWAPILPRTQPEQALRREAETLLMKGRVSEAIELMSRHTPEDFPPHFDPPPWLGYPDPRPPLLDVVEEVVERDGVAPWVREIYMRKLDAKVRNRWFLHLWRETDPAEKDRYLAVFERAKLADRHFATFELMSQIETDPMRKEQLVSLLAAASNR